MSAQENYGEAVLDDIRDQLSQFVQMPSKAALNTVALWLAHTHATDQEGRMVFDSTPRIAFLSDMGGSGKSTLLQIMEELANRGDWVTDPTAWGVVDAIGIDRETVLIDEIDMFLGAGNAGRKTVETLNSGYRKKAKTVRAGGKKVPIFGPVAMAGLGRVFKSAPQLHTLRSRSITITMVPRAGVTLETYRSVDDDPYLNVLRTALGTWVRSELDNIRASRPTLPDGVADRDAEVWEPLFVMAEQAGGHWPADCLAACMQLGQGKGESVLTVLPATAIVADLEAVFADGSEWLSTEDIVRALFAMPDSRWKDLWVTPAAAPKQLARLLKTRYNVEDGVAVRDGDTRRRGYHRKVLEPLWG